MVIYFIYLLSRSNKPDVEEITIDPSANWTAVEGQKDTTDDDSEG